MDKFKEQDFVKIVNPPSRFYGRIGKVFHIWGSKYAVAFDNFAWSWFAENELAEPSVVKLQWIKSLFCLYQRSGA